MRSEEERDSLGHRVARGTDEGKDHVCRVTPTIGWRVRWTAARPPAGRLDERQNALGDCALMHPYLRLQLHLRAAGALKAAIELKSSASPTEALPASEPLHAPLLRRVLGKALIDRFCSFGHPHCEDRPRPPPQGPAATPRPTPRDLCRLAEACPYGVLFAASLTPRPPYAMFVPPGEGAGESARVEITLFGPAWRLYPWALGALASALRHGVGKERRSWLVEEVQRIHTDRRPEPLAGGDLARLPPDLAPDLLNLALEPYLAPQPVTVLFLSPARLLRDGRLLPGREPVPFHLLIARILDRFAGLYGPEASEALRPEIRGAIEAEAARVPVIEDDTRWLEVPDYSARSRSELLLGGKVGRAVYGDGAARFLPILRAGEILHAGKNAASGNGRIQVDLPPPPVP